MMAEVRTDLERELAELERCGQAFAKTLELGKLASQAEVASHVASFIKQRVAESREEQRELLQQMLEREPEAFWKLARRVLKIKQLESDFHRALHAIYFVREDNDDDIDSVDDSFGWIRSRCHRVEVAFHANRDGYFTSESPLTVIKGVGWLEDESKPATFHQFEDGRFDIAMMLKGLIESERSRVAEAAKRHGLVVEMIRHSNPDTATVRVEVDKAGNMADGEDRFIRFWVEVMEEKLIEVEFEHPRYPFTPIDIASMFNKCNA